MGILWRRLRARRCAQQCAGQLAPSRRGQRGFTMIELLITMLLLTIVLTGLAALQLGAVRQVSNSKRGSEATRLGQAVLEQLKTLGWSHTLLADSGGSFASSTNADGQVMTNVKVNGLNSLSTAELDGPYTVTQLIEDVGSGTRKIITVRVTWLDTQTGVDPTQRYAVRSVTLVTQRAQ